VAHPQVAAFARLANGAQMPQRTVFGQASKLSRTMHDIRYDEVHDEFFVVNPFAEAILVFRGGADGQQAPVRVIQGPNAQIGGSRLDVDPIHNEIFVPDGNRIRVYPREANGDVAPIRIIEGPDTRLRNAQSLAVDPINNILVVGFNKNRENDPDGSILIFNRTDNGNVKPRAVIHGPKSGIIRINQMAVYPPKRLIVAAMPGDHDAMEPPDAFLGIWTYDDNGDIPPKWKIPIGPRTTLKKPFGVTLNPKNKEVIVSDMRLNGVLTFSVPEIF
jgi:hypothetical protein